jgi:hypothetical protein
MGTFLVVSTLGGIAILLMMIDSRSGSITRWINTTFEIGDDR